MMLRYSLLAIAIASIASACLSSRPVVDTGSKPPGQDGTIAGHVSSDGDAPVVSRKVRIVPLEGGTPYETTTNNAGTYTVKVRPGRYRLEVELRPGERVVKQPEDTEVNPSDLDPDRNFVISSTGGA
jgi:hypothetical protein